MNNISNRQFLRVESHDFSRVRITRRKSQGDLCNKK